MYGDSVTVSNPTQLDATIMSVADEAQRKADAEAQREPDADWKPTRHERAIIYTLAILGLIVALDATIIVTALNTIAADLSANATQAFWIGTSYLLANAVAMPLLCAASDVFGRPACLEFALLAFTAGTACCCAARGITTMLVGRVIQGVGGAGIHGLGLVAQTDIVPLRHRPKWYGITLAAWALGLAIGPIIGGAVVQTTTWRWIFYLMFPILGFGLVMVPYLLTLKPKKATTSEKLGRIDWVGSIIFAGSATSFLIAVSWGGTQFAWSSVQTLVPLIIGVVGLFTTAAYETYLAPNPFLRRTLFHNTSSVMTYAAGCFQGMVLYGFIYYGPFYFLSVKAFSALETGIAMLPCTLTITLSGIVSGHLVTRFNNYRWFICAGWLIASIGAGLFLIWPYNDTAGVWVVTLLVLGVGQGTVLNAQNFASQAQCKPGDEASAAAMYAFARQFGMALGVGLGGTVFQNVMAMKLRWLALPVEIAKQAEAYIYKLHSMDPGTFRVGVYHSYEYGFIGTYAFFLAVSGSALIISVIFIRNVDMTRKLQSDHHLDGTRIEKHWGN
ncbi:major facilitator superfamily transporter [Xylariaceae sp. FL0804]|nr:major facilitator superfamily transporter [Xylariaceae sp. FL0804]